MSQEARSPAEAKALVAGQLGLWHRAVEMQHDRIMGSDFGVDSQVDGLLFALALRNLIRAVEMAGRLGVPAERVALDRFYSEIDHPVEARDLIDHFDDYIEGKGKLQHPDRKRRGGKPQLRGYLVFFERSVDDFTLHVGDWQLKVRQATAAAARLVDEVMDAL